MLRKDPQTISRMAALLSVFAALLSLVGISGIANAANPTTQPSARSTQIQRQQQPFSPLENASSGARPAAPYATSPAARVTNDPHWRANVRANTDTTTYAQQEPAMAVNPLNPLNVVVANKDERNAPSPGTETKQVYIE